jgi:hypothetical protein
MKHPDFNFIQLMPPNVGEEMLSAASELCGGIFSAERTALLVYETLSDAQYAFRMTFFPWDVDRLDVLVAVCDKWEVGAEMELIGACRGVIMPSRS